MVSLLLLEWMNCIHCGCSFPDLCCVSDLCWNSYNLQLWKLCGSFSRILRNSFSKFRPGVIRNFKASFGDSFQIKPQSEEQFTRLMMSFTCCILCQGLSVTGGRKGSLSWLIEVIAHPGVSWQHLAQLSWSLLWMLSLSWVAYSVRKGQEIHKYVCVFIYTCKNGIEYFDIAPFNEVYQYNYTDKFDLMYCCWISSIVNIVMKKIFGLSYFHSLASEIWYSAYHATFKIEVMLGVPWSADMYVWSNRK